MISLDARVIEFQYNVVPPSEISVPSALNIESRDRGRFPVDFVAQHIHRFMKAVSPLVTFPRLLCPAIREGQVFSDWTLRLNIDPPGTLGL